MLDRNIPALRMEPKSLTLLAAIHWLGNANFKTPDLGGPVGRCLFLMLDGHLPQDQMPNTTRLSANVRGVIFISKKTIDWGLSGLAFSEGYCLQTHQIASYCSLNWSEMVWNIQKNMSPGSHSANPTLTETRDIRSAELGTQWHNVRRHVTALAEVEELPERDGFAELNLVGLRNDGAPLDSEIFGENYNTGLRTLFHSLDGQLKAKIPSDYRKQGAANVQRHIFLDMAHISRMFTRYQLKELSHDEFRGQVELYYPTRNFNQKGSDQGWGTMRYWTNWTAFVRDKCNQAQAKAIRNTVFEETKAWKWVIIATRGRLFEMKPLGGTIKIPEQQGQGQGKHWIRVGLHPDHSIEEFQSRYGQGNWQEE